MPVYGPCGRFARLVRIAIVLTMTLDAAHAVGENADVVRLELAAQDAWLDAPRRVEGWRRFLLREILDDQLDQQDQADPAELTRVIHRYQSGAEGIDLPPFRRVCRSIDAWRQRLLAERSTDLPALARASRNDLGSVAPERLDQARRHFSESLGRLERRIDPHSPNGLAWKAHLGWDALARQASLGHDLGLDSLQDAYYRLTLNDPGLDLDEFQELARSIRTLLDWSVVTRAKDPSALYAGQMERIALLLQEDPNALDPYRTHELERRWSLLQGLGQSPYLSEAFDRLFGRSNLWVVASERLLNLMATRPVDDLRPVRETILGTRLCGWGRTRGQVVLRTVPSEKQARLLFSLGGTVESRTRGYNGPAVLHSAGNTSFEATKQVLFDGEALIPTGADVAATTCSRTHDIQKRGGGVGSRIVESIAWKKVSQQKRLAETVANGKASRKIAASFDRDVNAALAEGEAKLDAVVRVPLHRRHASPRRVTARTTDHSLELAVLQQTRGEVAASSDPPLPESGDLTIRLHQSAANNLATAIVGGALLSQQAEDSPPTLNGRTPEWADRLTRPDTRVAPKSDIPFQPWSVRFRRRRPISFTFSENRVNVILHAAALFAGEREYRGWDLLFSYRAIATPDGFRLERVGEIDAYPLGFDPRTGGKIRGRQLPLRSNLVRQLNERSNAGRGIPRSIDLRSLALKGASGASVGRLGLNLFQAEEGWLGLAWEVE